MAIDYNIIRQIGMDPVQQQGNPFLAGVGQGVDRARMERFKQIAGREFKSGKPNLNAILAGYSMVDPASALRMQFGGAGGRGMTDQDKRLQAMQSPEAQAIIKEIESTLQQAIDLREREPKASINTYLNKVQGLVSQYRALTGKNPSTRLIATLTKELSTERRFLEQDADDSEKVWQNVQSRVFQSIDTNLSNMKKANTNMKKALDLFQQVDNPTALATAVKQFVQAIDESVVHKGEIEPIAGGTVWDSLRTFAERMFVTGKPFSPKVMGQFWDAFITTAQAADKITQNYIDKNKELGDALFEGSKVTGQLTEDSVSRLNEQIGRAINARLSAYTLLPDGPPPRPNYNDIFSGGGEKSPQPPQESQGIDITDPVTNAVNDLMDF